MNIEAQVCNLELALRLKELGAYQDLKHGDFAYCDCCDKNPLHAIREDNDTSWLLGNDYGHQVPSEKAFEWTKAFTVAELGEMLPLEIGECQTRLHIAFSTIKPGKWTVGYANHIHHVPPIISESNEADARAKLLVYLIEKGIVKP